VHCAPPVTGTLAVRRWSSTQEAALVCALQALPDVLAPLSRAEVYDRQEQLRAAVFPRRSWVSVYIKIRRAAPYGLDLGHLLKAKLGNTCRQHMTPAPTVAARQPGRRKCRSGPSAPAAEPQVPPQAGDGRASPLVFEPSDDGALDSPAVLRVEESPSPRHCGGECVPDILEMGLWC